MLFNTWSPFFDVSKTLDEVERLLGAVGHAVELRSVPRGTFPAINVYDQEDSVVMTAEVPGMDPNALDLTVLNDSITLKGERKADPIGQDARYYRKEMPVGQFTRTVTLPEPVDTGSVDATYTNGVLRVRLEKAEQAKAKKIQIRA